MSTNQKMPLTKACARCKRQYQLMVNIKDHDRWLEGELIQDAMPYLTADERELLISGFCGPCFDKLFPEE